MSDAVAMRITYDGLRVAIVTGAGEKDFLRRFGPQGARGNWARRDAGVEESMIISGHKSPEDPC